MPWVGRAKSMWPSYDVKRTIMSVLDSSSGWRWISRTTMELQVHWRDWRATCLRCRCN